MHCLLSGCSLNLMLDILKFEYMTQLLLDSNYLPLILKMFIHQEVDRAIAQKNDRDDQRYAFI
jgi:hypothetical protein